jgi:hypothetical protein
VPSNAATYCKLGFTIDTDPKLGAPWTLYGVDDNEPYLINIVELPNDSISTSLHPFPLLHHVYHAFHRVLLSLRCSLN